MVLINVAGKGHHFILVLNRNEKLVVKLDSRARTSKVALGTRRNRLGIGESDMVKCVLDYFIAGNLKFNCSHLY